MNIVVIKTTNDGSMFSYEYETLNAAMLNIEMMKKDKLTQFVDVTYFERIYNKDAQR